MASISVLADVHPAPISTVNNVLVKKRSEFESVISLALLKSASHSVAQARLELPILHAGLNPLVVFMSQPHKCWDSRY